MLYSLCHIAKNLYNVALYSINENYKVTGKFLSYEANYHVCKTNENYSFLIFDRPHACAMSLCRDFLFP